MYLAMMYCFGPIVNKKNTRRPADSPAFDAAAPACHRESSALEGSPPPLPTRSQGRAAATLLKKNGNQVGPVSREKLAAIFPLKILTIPQRFAIST